MKNQLLAASFVLVLCFIFSCQNRAEKAGLEAVQAWAKIEEQNIDLTAGGLRKPINEILNHF